MSRLFAVILCVCSNAAAVYGQEPAAPPEPQPDQKADAKEPPTPEHTGVHALFGNLGRDIKKLPAMREARIVKL